MLPLTGRFGRLPGHGEWQEFLEPLEFLVVHTAEHSDTVLGRLSELGGVELSYIVGAGADLYDEVGVRRGEVREAGFRLAGLAAEPRRGDGWKHANVETLA